MSLLCLSAFCRFFLDGATHYALPVFQYRWPLLWLLSSESVCYKNGQCTVHEGMWPSPVGRYKQWGGNTALLTLVIHILDPQLKCIGWNCTGSVGPWEGFGAPTWGSHSSSFSKGDGRNLRQPSVSFFRTRGDWKFCSRPCFGSACIYMMDINRIFPGC